MLPLMMAAMLLAGCTASPSPVVTRLPTDASRPLPSDTPRASAPASANPGPAVTGGRQGCGGAPVVLTPGSASWMLSGDCPDVRVSGNDLVVDLTAADVDALSIAGDRITASLDDADAVTVAGNDVVITADEIDALVVRGDRNAITATDSIDSVVVQGNDNAVRGADHSGQVSDEGARNTFG